MGSTDSDFLYGINPVVESLRAGRREFYRAWLQAGSRHPRLSRIEHQLERLQIPWQKTEKGRLIDRCKSREHQGIVLECSRYPMADEAHAFVSPRLVMVDNVEDPHNLGAILRSAEGFGFTTVLLPLKGVPGVYPSVIKASAGAAEHLQVIQSRTPAGYLRGAQEAGYCVLALDRKGDTTLEAARALPKQPTLLVVGGEDRGVGQFVLNQADAVIAIRQQGKINSLNASVAAGVAMHALANQSTITTG